MKDLEKIITKELLRSVLPKETENLSDSFSFTINEDYIEFSDDGEMQFEYCIYKFVFKCQESAIVKGFDICPKMDSKGFYRLLTDDNIIGFTVEDKFIFSESINPCSSRVEAIFKAYEWILKEVKDK